jgi:voltage-gated potassium channel
MYHKTKQKVHSLLHPEIVGESHWDRIINIFIIVLIILNVTAVILETVPSIEQNKPLSKFFRDFDLVSVVIFTIEYILRVWSSNHDPRYKHSIYGRLRYMVSPAALIDLIAILPFYIIAVLPLLASTTVAYDFRLIRILRLLRFFRLFRLTAYTRATKMVVNVFKSRMHDLVLAFVIALFFIFTSSFMVYFAEHEAQPQKFTSIPETIWWAVETITTIGYGDLYPITALGKFFTIIIMLSGIALLAFPSGIITAGFMEELNKSKKPRTCPHCGKPIDDEHSSH